MDTLVALDKCVTRLIESILILLFVAFLIMVCVNVGLRYVFAKSILGGDQFVTIAFIFTSALGAAVGIAKREHIAMTFFIDQTNYALKKALYIVGLALIALVNVALIYYAIGWISKAGHFPWQPFNLPQGYVHAAIPIGSGLAIFFCMIKIILTLAERESIEVLWMPED